MAEFVLHKDIAHRLSQYLIMWQKNMNNSILHDASQQPIWLKKTSYLVDEELDVVGDSLFVDEILRYTFGADRAIAPYLVYISLSTTEKNEPMSLYVAQKTYNRLPKKLDIGKGLIKIASIGRKVQNNTLLCCISPLYDTIALDVFESLLSNYILSDDIWYINGIQTRMSLTETIETISTVTTVNNQRYSVLYNAFVDYFHKLRANKLLHVCYDEEQTSTFVADFYSRFIANTATSPTTTSQYISVNANLGLLLHDMQNFLQEQKKRYADIRQYSDSYVPSFVDDLGIITLQKAIQQQQSVDVSSIFVCQYCKSSQRFAYASRYTLPYMTIKQLIHFPYTFFITYDGTFRSQVFERLFEYKKRAILLLASRQDMGLPTYTKSRVSSTH